MAEKKENRLAFRVSDAMLEKFKGLGVAYKIEKSQPLFEALVEKAAAGALEPVIVHDRAMFEAPKVLDTPGPGVDADSDWRLSPCYRSAVRRMGERLQTDDLMLVLDTVIGWFEDTFEGRPAAGLQEVLAGASLEDAMVEDAAATPSLIPGTFPEDGPEMGCVHCGVAFRILVGAKFTDICPGCATDGHLGDVRDCPACGKGGAL